MIFHYVPFVLLFLHFSFGKLQSALDPEVYQTAVIIESKGYWVKEYVVATEDGFYLTLQRVAQKSKLSNAQRNVVLLQHGLLDSAHTWINNLANQSLGFILADLGFDVWLGNSRGSTYSQRHAYLQPSDLAFWEFSWDEMAHYDLPAVINFIVGVTGVDKIFYVGHSQGAAIAFSKLNSDAALRSRVAAFAALAPAVYLGDVESPFRLLVPVCKTLEVAKVWLGSRRFLPSNWLVRFLTTFVCQKENYPFVCKNIIFLLAGYNAKNLNTTRLPVYVSHTPAGTSVQNIVHYCQSISHGRFQAFDFGTKKNIEKYNQTAPPLFHLDNFDIPTSVYYGGRDWLAAPQDVERILLELPKVPGRVRSVYLPDYNHLDFVWGLDAAKLVYSDIVEFFRGHQ
ncbi:unnamed protein product [Mesocestoides corti]|uniref:Lipase n=1 Tax=Mesocestoides corti TaxID=53468 RepID=A0A0R3U291_MESCO|nr:unnamed protein product [Mesocestoides corti]